MGAIVIRAAVGGIDVGIAVWVIRDVVGTLITEGLAEEQPADKNNAPIIMHIYPRPSVWIIVIHLT